MPIQDFFRLKNVFGGGDDNALPSYPTYGSSDYSDIDSSDSPILEQFAQSVLNPPDRTGPSKMRMLGTGLLSALQGSTDPASEKKGFWGSLANKPFNIDQTSSVLNMPYDQKVEDWKLRTGALEKAANIESQLPARRAMARYRETQADILPQREGRLGREGENRAQLGVDKLELDKQKLALNEWKARNPNGRVIPVKGGNVIVVNPQTGEALDTGINSGILSDEERVNLTGEKRLEQIGAQGQVRKDVQGMIGDQRLEQIDASGEESRRTKQTIPGKAASVTGTGIDKPLLPAQEKTRLQLKANEATQEHPEWAEFISIDPNNGMVKIEPPNPGKFWDSGPSKEMYDEMIKYISGEKKASPTAVPAKTTAPAATKAPAKQVMTRQVKNKNTGEVKTQISDDGGKTWRFK